MICEKELSGILPVNKPQGWTSFDVVAKLRGVMKIKRLGHAGTLDPMATGVLPVLVGKATKACDILPDTTKVYKAGFMLGVTTDTLDITGQVLDTKQTNVSLYELEKTSERFVGEIMQIPPMYSAVKVGGKRLYQLAREGKTVQRTARKCIVHSITVMGYDEKTGRGTLEVSCDKGTYVRTIIDDIGNALGTGAVMTSLVRTYSGGIDITQSNSIDRIQQLCAQHELAKIIVPLQNAFEIYDGIYLDDRLTALYKNGVKLCAKQLGVTDSAKDKLYRVFGVNNEFLGIAGFENSLLRSRKNFY